MLRIYRQQQNSFCEGDEESSLAYIQISLSQYPINHADRNHFRGTKYLAESGFLPNEGSSCVWPLEGDEQICVVWFFIQNIGPT